MVNIAKLEDRIASDPTFISLFDHLAGIANQTVSKYRAIGPDTRDSTKKELQDLSNMLKARGTGFKSVEDGDIQRGLQLLNMSQDALLGNVLSEGAALLVKHPDLTLMKRDKVNEVFDNIVNRGNFQSRLAPNLQAKAKASDTSSECKKCIAVLVLSLVAELAAAVLALAVDVFLAVATAGLGTPVAIAIAVVIVILLSMGVAISSLDFELCWVDFNCAG